MAMLVSVLPEKKKNARGSGGFVLEKEKIEQEKDKCTSPSL